MRSLYSDRVVGLDMWSEAKEGGVRYVIQYHRLSRAKREAVTQALIGLVIASKELMREKPKEPVR